MNKKIPRGIRNRNPLNIRSTGSRWQGSFREKIDPDFVTFSHMRWGYRAAWILMLRYWQHFYRKSQPYTLRNVISRWAPPNDGNDTEAYIRRVTVLASIGGEERLPNPKTYLGRKKFIPILAAMTCVECGISLNEVDQKSITEGFRLAFPDATLTDEDEESVS